MKTLRNMFSHCNSKHKYGATVILASGVLSLSGCVVGPNYHLPPAPTPPAYKEVGDWKAAQPSDDKLGGKWWEIFQDPQLNALEEQIDVSNQNLKAAFAQYQQSRAVLRQYRADYYPTVTANPSAGRTRYSNNRPPHKPSFSGVTFNDFVLPLELGYEADVWGRVRRTVESYRAQAQASAADLADRQSQYACQPGCRLLRSPQFGRRRKAFARYRRPIPECAGFERCPLPGRTRLRSVRSGSKNSIRNNPRSSDRRRCGASAV